MDHSEALHLLSHFVRETTFIGTSAGRYRMAAFIEDVDLNEASGVTEDQLRECFALAETKPPAPSIACYPNADVRQLLDQADKSLSAARELLKDVRTELYSLSQEPSRETLLGRITDLIGD